MSGVRGVAALLVAVYHYFHPLMPRGSVADRLFGRGYLYVDLFFVLSGYVMALNYGSMFSTRIRLMDVQNFLWKRFARVYPLYFCVTVAMAAGYFAVYHDFIDHHSWIVVILSKPLMDVPLNIMLVQAWGYRSGIVGQAWSISTEATAYLYFPLFALLCARCGKVEISSAVLVCFAAIPAAVWLAEGDGLYHAGTLDLWTGPPALVRCFGGFSLGICLYRIAGWERARYAFTDSFGAGLTVLYAVLLLNGAPDLALYPVFPLLILCLAGNQGWFGRAFGCRPIYVLGLFSYSFYLLHAYLIPPLYRLERQLSAFLLPWVAWGLAAGSMFIVLLLVAGLAYVGIERPARRMLRELVTQRGGRGQFVSGSFQDQGCSTLPGALN
ncbi:MAG: acyltransferase [Acidobacteriaceae bacterium]|nr:acyltransferase [Acidobacteriaceae bacterium]